MNEILQPFIKDGKIDNGKFYEKYQELIRLTEEGTNKKDMDKADREANRLLEARAQWEKENG